MANGGPFRAGVQAGQLQQGDLIGIQQLEPKSIRPSLLLACAAGKEQGPFVLESHTPPGPRDAETTGRARSLSLRIYLLDSGESRSIRGWWCS